MENELRRWFGIQHDCGMGRYPEERGEKYRPCWHWFGDWFPERADRFLTTLSLFFIRPRYVLGNWWEVRQYKRAIRTGDEDTKRRLLLKAMIGYRKIQEKGK